jgi:glycosyltransferase involved in cell wall biosynthesis
VNAHPHAVHQVVPVLLHADAIGDETRAIRDGLRARGFASEVYALPQTRPPANIDPSALPIDALLALRDDGRPDAVLYHFAVGSAATALLNASGLPVVLIHHNITPPRWFRMVDPDHELAVAAAEAELPALRGHVALALGDSEFNRRELDAMGFAPTGVLPILLDPQPYRDHRPGPLHKEISAAPTLLSVGRVAPNKCIEDCIRLLAAYRAGVDPRARLWIAGDDTRLPVYRDALGRLVTALRLDDSVRFLGRVSQQELVDCYQGAAAYVSMSEHEGFAVPLLEAMICELPILAYASTAVPYTLGAAGLQVEEKDFPVLAEALGTLLSDALALREHAERGRRRAEELAPERTLDHLVEVLSGLST